MVTSIIAIVGFVMFFSMGMISCNYIIDEIENDDLTVNVTHNKPAKPAKQTVENLDQGSFQVNIERSFNNTTEINYKRQRIDKHDYIVFSSVYGLSAVHDPDCSCTKIDLF